MVSYANDIRAIEIANTCTRKLIAKQGPNGEWPWFFDAARGLVRRLLRGLFGPSVRNGSGIPRSRTSSTESRRPEARIIKGFNWILGQNQLGIPMLVPDLHLTIRSQVRKGELYSKKWRVLRALGNSILGREARLIDPADLELRHECRSYELGWILWSFGQRSDLPELTHNEMFIEALQRSNSSELAVNLIRHS